MSAKTQRGEPYTIVKSCASQPLESGLSIYKYGNELRVVSYRSYATEGISPLNAAFMLINVDKVHWVLFATE